MKVGDSRHLTRVLLFVSALAALQCAHNPPDDPLKNSKKLIVRGHKSLYENGAFAVPGTHLRLIPPGPDTLELAGELAGPRAQTSFAKAIEAAGDSVYIVAQGTKMSFHMAETVSERGTDARRYIQQRMRPKTIFIVYKSSAVGKELIGKSWQTGKTAGENVEAVATAMANSKDSENFRIRNEKSIRESTTAMARDADQDSHRSAQEYRTAMGEMRNGFVLGIAAIPAKLAADKTAYDAARSQADFAKDFAFRDETRHEFSTKMTYLMHGTFVAAGTDSGQSFQTAGKEASNIERQGPALAYLKALGWVVKGVLWDSVIVPIGKLTAGSLGYAFINGVAFPFLVVSDGTINSGMIGVELVKLGAKSGYDLAAPTVSAAVAGVLNSAALVAEQTGASARTLASAGARAAGIGAIEVVSATEKAGLKAGEETIRYVGVPVSTVVVTAGSALSGALVTTGGLAAGAVTSAVSETVAFGTDGATKIAAGAALGGGAVGSALAGTAVGVYEVGQSMVVPASLTLGAGLTLTYGTLTHLSAQTILAASDCAYVVLSMEGTRFVVYAVKGLVTPKADLAPGSIVDLERLRSQGEVIKRVPVTDEELKAVVNDAHANLPRVDN